MEQDLFGYTASFSCWDIAYYEDEMLPAPFPLYNFFFYSLILHEVSFRLAGGLCLDLNPVELGAALCTKAVLSLKELVI